MLHAFCVGSLFAIELLLSFSLAVPGFSSVVLLLLQEVNLAHAVVALDIRGLYCLAACTAALYSSVSQIIGFVSVLAKQRL